MNERTLMFLVGAGLGFGPVQRASKLHPMRDPEGHPQGGGNEGGNGGGSEGDSGADDNDSSNDSSDDDSGAQQGSQSTKKSSKDDADNKGPDWKSTSRQWENRAKATDAQLKQIKKALGIAKDDELDPKELADELGTTRSKATTLLRENAVLRAAPAGVDVEAMLDSKSFEKALEELDPEDEKFRAKVKTLVEKEIERRPSLAGKKKTSTTRTGTPSTGESDAKTQLTRADLAKMSPEAIVKAQSEGRLKDLLGTK